ncbi:hypothetical protein NDA18_001173 [Ustilago nuda]|nr:hypothetical protein NDA18_001173 [Ustilago nuda]
MVDRIPSRSQHAAASFLSLLRFPSNEFSRLNAVASKSYSTLITTTNALPSISRGPQPSYSRTFTSTPHTNVSAHRKQSGREKARLRSMRLEEKVLRRREKDGYPTISSPSSPRRRPRDPVEEETDSTIREYMARTGPRGERLTLAQQERLLKQELRGLGLQLEKLEKKAKADEATQDLPELDDHTLEEIYEALMLPPPPTKEEVRLARLEDGRRERGLLKSERGRKGVLPISVTEEKKGRLTRDLKQRLLDAREKGRVLLPPSTSSVKKEAARLAEVDLELEGQEEEVDMAALPYAERQEIRLQQLFARLALVHSTPDPQTSGGSESLQEVKSSLATRIVKILQEHEYELPSSAQKLQPDNTQTSEDATGAAQLPPFKEVRLDANTASLPTSTNTEGDPHAAEVPVPRTKAEVDLVEKAESMINNLTSTESRTFMLDSIERTIRSASPSSSANPQPASIPLGVASIDEWTALAVSSARSSDFPTLTRTLDLMQLSGYKTPLSTYNSILNAFASSGDVASCQTYLYLLTSQGVTPDEYTHHTLVKAYATAQQYLPAIQLLNSLESSGAPASMATYTLLISRLLSPTATVKREEKPELQTLAWNLFYHMRLNAHPIPDAPLYALMIRACARGIPQPTDIDTPTTTSQKEGFSDAERALDLFREMTTRYHVRPNAEVYNSLILACARRKDFYLEAFRLLREMVELELSNPSPETGGGAEGMMCFAPDRYTFNALLQGCARNRDLARARWVLAEMIRTTLPLFDDEVRKNLGRAEVMELVAKRPGEETMCHIFHTYASYTPPLKREQLQMTPSAPQQSAPTPPSEGNSNSDTTQTGSKSEATCVEQGGTSELATQTNTQLEKAKDDAEEEETSAEEAAQIFSSLIPQTSSDLVSEARSLFARILADQPSPSPHSSAGLIEGPLGGVTPSVRLVNSYLTVLAAHLPPQHRVRVLYSTLSPDPEAVFESGLFQKLGLVANEHAYRIILEAMRNAAEGETGLVREVWEELQSFLSHKQSTGGKEVVRIDGAKQEEKVDAIQIKKCWTAYLHFWAKNNHLSPPNNEGKDGLDYAVDLLRQFYDSYPPVVELGKRSKKAQKRQKEALRASLRPSGELGDLDLSPLPIPLQSLQTLQQLQSSAPTKPEKEEQTEVVQESEAERGELEWMLGKPTLTFLDVELLHHRLVRFGRTKDLAFVSWILHRYAAANRKR